MVKVRLAGNRLSVGSWSVPYRSDSQKSRNDQEFGAATIPAAKTPGSSAAPSTNEDHVAAARISPPPPDPITNQRASKPKVSLVELAKIITKEAEKLENYLTESGTEGPGFDVDSPLNFPKLPDEIKKSREEIVRATKDMEDLVTGPTESVRWMAWDHNNSLSLHAIYHYQIAKSFPLHETATFAQIADKVGLDELNTRRFLRHAMTNRIFCEPSPGVVAHTAASRVLAEDAAMDSWVGFSVEDMWPAASKTVDALELNPAASDVTQTGFCVSEGTIDQKPMFVTLGEDPTRAKRFGGAMASLTGGVGYEVSYLLDNYDWASIDANSGTVVDVGGSHGFVSVDLAKRFKNMRFVVQDLPKTINSAPKLADGLDSRITFQAHDFYTQQPVVGADVYLFRWILHNQSDRYAVNMLRQLIPALKKGARVVINDHCLPEPGQESLWDEKIIRTMDLVMLTLLNSQERSEGEFRELFRKVDERFKFVGVNKPAGCRMSILEAVWEGEDFGGAAGRTEEEPTTNGAGNGES